MLGGTEVEKDDFIIVIKQHMFYILHYILVLIEHSEVSIRTYMYVHLKKPATRRKN